MGRVLLATNPSYWPSVGGSERILERILSEVRDMFDEIVVFTESVTEPTEHNGVKIMPYSPKALLEFATANPPTCYFPNMVHSRMTFENIAKISRLSQRTVINMIGGYSPNSPLAPRVSHLDKVQKYTNAAIHVDALSTEYLIDHTINPRIKFFFLSQGLDFPELEPYKKLVGKSNKPYFLYAHNLWSWKHPEVYIEEIAARVPELNFKVLANDKTGDCIEETKAHAAKYKNVSLDLGLSRPDFLKTLAGAMAIVSTSSVEGAQPNIMLEAGYLGVPYLTLCPGQNYAHYPHVEMFYSLDDLRSRIAKAGYKLLDQKKSELARAQEFMSSPRFDWNEIIKGYKSLLTES